MTYQEFCKDKYIIRGEKKIAEVLERIEPTISSAMRALHLYGDKYWIIEEERYVYGTNIGGCYITGTLGFCEISLFKRLQESDTQY